MSDFFILVRRGLVQRHETQVGNESTLVWPVAQSHADAKKLCQWFNDDEIRPAQIGSVDGETLEGHIKMAVEEGCTAVCCVRGWDQEGSPIWGWLPLTE